MLSLGGPKFKKKYILYKTGNGTYVKKCRPSLEKTSLPAQSHLKCQEVKKTAPQTVGVGGMCEGGGVVCAFMAVLYNSRPVANV